jgi:hypothetical protein
MTTVDIQSNFQMWENFCGSQEVGFRRYRRIGVFQDEPHNAPSPRTRRHWGHPDQLQTSFNRTLQARSRSSSDTAETPQLSLSALVQQKSELLNPARHLLQQRIKEETETIQYVLCFVWC